MAPKKGSSRSTSAYSNGITFREGVGTPSRRSPRVPASTKANGDSNRSSKTVDLTSSPTSQDIRFYYPTTPPSSEPLPNQSPEQPSTRRRIFQARPSRLSNVYTPATETPSSLSQESRKTRRATALDTPNGVSLDKDAAANMGSTGWTDAQYMGGLDGTNDPPSPSAASSKGTRSSARRRKPTTRAIEALELNRSPRRNNTGPDPSLTDTPASPPLNPHSSHPPPSLTHSASAASETAPMAMSPPIQASTKNDPSEPVVQNNNKPARKPAKGKKAQKVPKQQKLQLLRIEIDLDTAGRNVYRAGVDAFSESFKLPPDPDWVINNARFAYFQARSGGQRTRRASDGDKNQPNLYDSETDTSGVRRFQRSAPPRIESDGWSYIGRRNERGEELMIHPPEHSLYWAPHTYGDKDLPYPPVRSRSDAQAEQDNSLGFPPLIGNRNIPFDVRSQFEAEDITEEKARVQARDEARQRAAAEPVRTRKPRAVKHRQSAPSSNIDPSVPEDNEEPEPKPKRRRAATRASLPAAAATPAAPTTPKPAAKEKTPKSKTTKAAVKKLAAVAATTPASAPATAPVAKNNENGPRPVLRLTLKAPKPEGQLDTPTVTNAPRPTETPVTGKGKKRPASSIDDDDTRASSGVKRARIAPGSDLESTPKGGKRTPAKKPTPASKSKEKGGIQASQTEAPSGNASTPKSQSSSRTTKGPRRSGPSPASRARGRGRGRG
ncbi:hypothetical protein N7456_004719 [Penicillium angulare]|uniref:Uncharacterized protein n=1 Tax=Penicillium angulare TaxID=116970 RepID=A0A9W9KIM6_9EURO|nr:hypothetical protein N7456_004719 [Penicillium angulare]